MLMMIFSGHGAARLIAACTSIAATILARLRRQHDHPAAQERPKALPACNRGRYSCSGCGVLRHDFAGSAGRRLAMAQRDAAARALPQVPGGEYADRETIYEDNAVARRDESRRC